MNRENDFGWRTLWGLVLQRVRLLTFLLLALRASTEAVHSAPAAVQPSISTIPCKTFNNLIRPCYPVPVFVATHPRPIVSTRFRLPVDILTDPCPLITAHTCFKSFSCNTYGFPRKCCKQKTYGQAKPFRCNTYKKPGVGVPSIFPLAAQSCRCRLASPRTRSMRQGRRSEFRIR